jgi:hypothetical protein
MLVWCLWMRVEGLGAGVPGELRRGLARHLDRLMGPGLHFGVHDSFETGDGSSRQVQVGPKTVSGAGPFPAGSRLLLTVIITGGEVLFFQNLDRVGRVALPRPVTDCASDSSGGIFVGSASMSLGSLRFFPKALTQEDIKELYLYGAQLSDMSTGTQPFRAGEAASGAGLAQRSLESKLAGLESRFTEQQHQLEVALVIKAVQEQGAPVRPASPPMPTGDTASESFSLENGTHVASKDAANRSFYQLLTGPVRLTRTRDLEARSAGDRASSFRAVVCLALDASSKPP